MGIEIIIHILKLILGFVIFSIMAFSFQGISEPLTATKQDAIEDCVKSRNVRICKGDQKHCVKVGLPSEECSMLAFKCILESPTVCKAWLERFWRTLD